MELSGKNRIVCCSSWLACHWRRVAYVVLVTLCVAYGAFSVLYCLYKLFSWMAPVLIVLLFLPMFAWTLFTLISLLGLIGAGIVFVLFLLPALCGNRDSIFTVLASLIFAGLTAANAGIWYLLTNWYMNWGNTVF